ncbi:MAG: CoA transferase [Armatimonadota bacterium]|nr:CoA transferase [Armatimonadota bacterium]MDR7486028.1 CoA transferase [Armatimonadota bacterium]MDR7532599.1 CoA transferase [Armatimonadota bacterium]MDR7536192.1 CoA transferase [Armatimonadota bacterium]
MTALEGIRVLDLSQGAAGPICAMYLGDLGAEVVKVEPPGGEWGRGLGPPFVDGVAAAFIGMNRNKRSIVIDLKHPQARPVILRLVAGSDVLVESFRPGVMARLGLDYDTLRSDHPRLIYCAISAFGASGPWHDRPGVDGIVQAASGLMSVTGSPDSEPVKVGVPAADTTAGFLAAAGILAALFARERTGRGQCVDLSLLDALLAFQTVPLAMYLASGTPPGRTGSAAPYAAPNEAYPTADGHVMVAAYTPERWHALCAVLGRPDLAADPRFATNEARVAHRVELRDALAPIFRAMPTAHWLAVLEAADIVCGPILTYPELEAHPQVVHNGMLVALHHPQLGAARVVGQPLRLSATPPRISRPAPLPGEHTAAVLREAGITDDEIARLVAAGVVQSWAGRPPVPQTDPARR